MKNTIILIACLLFVFGNVVNAQENNIKVGISNLAYGDYNLSYERLVNTNQSINFRAGYFQPFSSYIMNIDLLSDEFTLEDMSGGFQTSFEYRFYFNKQNDMTGFYIAPYIRYARTGALFIDEIQDSKFDVTANIALFGLGGQLGYQWDLNNFSIDLYFMGLGVDRTRLKMEHVNIEDPEGYDYNTIKADVKDPFGADNFTFFEDRVEYDDDVDGSLKTKIPFIFPGIRLGFSIGYRF